MNIPITEAKAQLTDLVRRAENGETVVLTRHGKPAVRLVPAAAPQPKKLDRALIDEITRRAVAKLGPSEGPPGDHSFLYGDDGLPI
jgi:prevent-host-death family protein